MYLIMGVGVSNLAVIKKLKELNKKIIIVCHKNEVHKVMDNETSIILYEDLKYIDLSKVKYVIKSPGIPYHNKYVLYLKKYGLTILNEIELTYLLSKKKGKYIGVTGSVGKSSVVCLLYSLIKKKKDNVILAGNIGIPLISYLDKINKDTIIILEVSSFQLDDFNDMRFNIAVLLNIFDNHLDVYKSKSKYYLSKLSICKNLRGNDYLITDLDNEIIHKYINRVDTKTRVIDYKSNHHILGEDLYYKLNKVMSLSDYNLKGRGNLDNLKAVISVLNILNIELDIQELRKFTPLKYHLETYNINDITFVNDSKSTSASSLKFAIETYLSNNLILLFGGSNKNLEFNFISDYSFKRSICFGALSKEIASNIVVDSHFDNLKTALDYAFLVAKRGDIVLFSPGCASFDEFDNYIKRGEFFDEYVKRHYEK